MKLVIFCVETKKQAHTDDIYIDKAIKYYYRLGNDITLKYVYFDGKGNYKQKKIIKQIEKLIKDRSNHSVREIITEVVYCVDLDRYDADAEAISLNQEIKEFCAQYAYRFVWFCRDVGEVFLGHSVSDSVKVDEAKKFAGLDGVGVATRNSLSIENYARRKSNLLIVCDEIFDAV